MSSILLVGCGRMGSAMARGWLGQHDVIVFDPHAEAPAGARSVARIDLATLPTDLIIVLAVKPQMAEEVLSFLRPLMERGSLLVSVMAGITLSSLQSRLGGSTRLVRCMPNTPAAIGKGITAAVADRAVSKADQALVDTLLGAVGEVVWLDDEHHLDMVTAVSGSGPAYFFAFVEAMARAGVAGGLEPELAMRLARSTFVGAAGLTESDLASVAQLREQVTSPGGTTAAALARFAEFDALDCLVARAVDTAAKRSRELSQ